MSPDDPCVVHVTARDPARTDALARELGGFGVQVTRVRRHIGVITGSVERATIPRLRQLPGVLEVEEGGEVSAVDPPTQTDPPQTDPPPQR